MKNKKLFLLATLLSSFDLVNGQVPMPKKLTVAPGTISDSSVTLIWHKPDRYKNIKAYRLYQNGSIVATVKECNFRLTGLQPAHNYTYSIAAENEDGKLSERTVALRVRTKVRSVVLNIVNFGAKGDGYTLNTIAIQKAIDACPYQGTVRVPAGIFLSGALHLKSNMTLLIDKGGVLQGSQNEKDYLPMIHNRFEGWEMDTYASLINAGTLDSKGGYNTENIAIRGEGSIVGGSELLAKGMIAQKGMRGRGRLICLLNCRNVDIQGLEIKDSPCWTIHYVYSANVSCHDLTITSTVENGDGIDPDSSIDSYIFNCIFSNTDDCIAIKSGKNPEGYFIGKPTRNIQITSCDFKEGHGISIGSEISGGVSDILVRDCKAGALRFGLQIKGTAERGGIVERIRVQDCKLRKICILTKLPYNNDGAAAPKEPLFRDFEFSSIDMTEGAKQDTIIRINGFTNKAHYTSHLSFIDIKLPSGVAVSSRNAGNLVFKNVTTPEGQKPRFLLSNSTDIRY